MLLRAGSDDPHHRAGQRDRHQRQQSELPGDPEHHHDDAQDHHHGVEDLRHRLLQGLLDVVHVVGGAREQVTALAGIEVVQRQAVDLAFHGLAQVEDGRHGQPVQNRTLGPHEQGGDDVEDDDEGDQLREPVKVDAEAGAQVHRLGHVGEAFLPGGAQAVDHLLLARPRGEIARDDAGKDDVHRVAQHARGVDREDDGADVHCQHQDELEPMGHEQPDQSLGAGPELLRLARCAAGEVVTGHARLEGGELLIGHIGGVGRGGCACLRHVRRPPFFGTRQFRGRFPSSRAAPRGCRGRRSPRLP